MAYPDASQEAQPEAVVPLPAVPGLRPHHAAACLDASVRAQLQAEVMPPELPVQGRPAAAVAYPGVLLAVPPEVAALLLDEPGLAVPGPRPHHAAACPDASVLARLPAEVGRPGELPLAAPAR